MKFFKTAFLFLAVFFLSCEKNIEIESQGAKPLIVVEGFIETDEYPVVFLSKSLDYFGQINPQLLAGSFVRNADVKISNGTFTHQLKEYAITTNGFTVNFYSIDPANPATVFKGELNKNYTLNITAEGKSYFANTRIPIITRRVDSLWFENVPNATDTNWKKVMIKAFDAPGLGDYIRYHTKRNREEFLPGDPSVFDDSFIDGSSYELQVSRGKDRNNPPTDGDYNSFFRRGDTVVVKIAQIDKSTYDFWRTMEFSYQSIGNPFASPIKVLSNIKGTPALGYFGGYAPQYKSLIIPR